MVLARLAVLKACSVSLMSLGLSSTSRMSVRSSCMSGSLHCKVECRALADARLGPDPSAVAVDDALHDRQADAGPLEIFGAMQPLEHAKELVGVFHVEADSVVADEEDPFTAVVAGADLHRRAVTLARILECVVDQVHEHLLEQRRVAADGWQLANGNLYRTPFRVRMQFGEHLLHDPSGGYLDLAQGLAA